MYRFGSIYVISIGIYIYIYIYIKTYTPSCPTKHKGYWIDTLKTKAIMGLNFDFDDSF